MSGAATSTPLIGRRPAASSNDKKRLPFIQGLRFVAVGWIVVYHYCAYDPDSALGRWAVNFPLDIFTVLSGFVTHLAYRSRKIEGSLEFLGKRSTRLIFIYYFSSLLALAVKMTNFGLNTASPGPVAAIITFIPDMFALNAWFAIFYVIPVPGEAGKLLLDTVYPTNAPLWYVQALAFCWIAYPLYHKTIPALRGDKLHVALLAAGLFLVSLIPLSLYLVFPFG